MTNTSTDRAARPSMITIRTSATNHILAQGPLVREFEIELGGVPVACAEVNIGGDQTRRGPLISSL